PRKVADTLQGLVPSSKPGMEAPLRAEALRATRPTEATNLFIIKLACSTRRNPVLLKTALLLGSDHQRVKQILHFSGICNTHFLLPRVQISPQGEHSQMYSILTSNPRLAFNI